MPRWIFLALILVFGIWPAARAVSAESAAACRADGSFDDDDDEDDDPAGSERDDPPGIRFAAFGACHKISGSVAAVSQHRLAASGSGALAILSRSGAVSQQKDVYAGVAALRWESSRNTDIGKLITAAELGWTKDSDDDTAAGLLTVNELYASLAGWTAGYTDSLMKFLEPRVPIQDFRQTRQVGIFAYEHALSDKTSFSVAVESEMPLTSLGGLQTIDFSSPSFTARWHYDDDVVLHASMLVRQADLPNAADPHPLGWAATLGVTVPLTVLGVPDSLSGQFTYGINAVPYLGTTLDLGSLAGFLRATGPSQGWSAVGVYRRNWSESWQTNIFATHLEVGLELALARPSVALTRYGANIVFMPDDHFKIGAEIDLVEIDSRANGPLDLLPGSNGRATIGYLFAEWKF